MGVMHFHQSGWACGAETLRELPVAEGPSAYSGDTPALTSDSSGLPSALQAMLPLTGRCAPPSGHDMSGHSDLNKAT